MSSVIKIEGISNILNYLFDILSSPTGLPANHLHYFNLGGVIQMKFISTKSLATALTVATLSLGTVSSTYAADATAALDAAKKATSVAKKAGFEWKNWGKMFEKAAAAVKAGKADKAIKIANSLAMQGLAAQKQAEAAKKAGPRF